MFEKVDDWELYLGESDALFIAKENEITETKLTRNVSSITDHGAPRLLDSYAHRMMYGNCQPFQQQQQLQIKYKQIKRFPIYK